MAVEDTERRTEPITNDISQHMYWADALEANRDVYKHVSVLRKGVWAVSLVEPMPNDGLDSSRDFTQCHDP